MGVKPDPPGPPPPPVPMLCDAQVVLGFWKEFNLDGRRLQLDKQVRAVIHAKAVHLGFSLVRLLAAIMFLALFFAGVIFAVTIVAVPGT